MLNLSLSHFISRPTKKTLNVKETPNTYTQENTQETKVLVMNLCILIFRLLQPVLERFEKYIKILAVI